MMKKTIIVFFEYVEADSWSGREILSAGTMIWVGHDMLQTLGTEDHEWDEIIIVEFSDKKIRDDAQKSVAEDKTIKNYKIILINPFPREQMDKMNKTLRAFVDSPIDTTPGQNILEGMTGGDLDLTRERLKLLRQRDKKIPFVMVVLNRFKDVAVYPGDYKGEKESNGREAYKLYGRIAVQYQGKNGAQMPLAGNVMTTVNGDEVWEDFVLIRYSSNVDFENTFTPKVIQEVASVHRYASLESTRAWAVTPYDDFL